MEWKFKGDKLSSQERLKAYVNGEKLDHVGLFLFARGFCAKSSGISLSEFYTDPQQSFDAQTWVQQMFGQDESLKFGIASFGAWEFGGEIKMPSNEFGQVPMVLQAPVQTEADVDKMQLPDVETAGMTPTIFKFSKIQEKAGVIRTLLIGSPFTAAANICSIENLSKWTLKKPDLVHQVLRITTDYCLKLAKYWVTNFGAENIEFRTATPVESNQVISPKTFEKFALPYLIELHQKVLNMGVKYIYTHICGEQNKNLPFYTQIPFGDPGILSFGHEVDLLDAIKYLGKSNVIMGNVEPSIIQTGTPSQIYQISKECIEKAKNAPRGFILGPGCELPPMAPSCNVWAMRKAINDFGWYE